MLAATTGVPEHKLRVVAPAVGGGFGSKLNVYAEELLALALARKLRAPVRWTEERTENAHATIQGRGQIQDIELAADADGKVTAVRVHLLADMGAYLQLVTPGIPLLGAFLYHGVYDIPAYSFTCTGVFTNKTPTDAYRGAGRPEATYAIERAMDALARKVGVGPGRDPAAQLHPHRPVPVQHRRPGSCSTAATTRRPSTRRSSWSATTSARPSRPRRRTEGDTASSGIGLSTYVEMCGLAPSRVLASLNYGAGGWEAATVRVLPTGKVQVVTGATPHGQGHETSWSMIVADKLGVSPTTSRCSTPTPPSRRIGMDTYGSRSLSVGGTAIVHGGRPGGRQGPHASPPTSWRWPRTTSSSASGDVPGEGQRPTRSCSIQALAFAGVHRPRPARRHGAEPRGPVTWDPPNFIVPVRHATSRWSRSTRRPGTVELVDYVAVDDCGNQVNPLIVEGQVHGGIAQGVAQALWEEAVYDDDGNLQNPTLADYLVPSAAELPSFTLDHTVTPSPTNPMGVKGIGEAGTIATTPAVMNAIVDALSPFGVTDIAMPASPERVWPAIQASKGASA